MKLISHNSYLLVRPIKEEEKKTTSGIILVDNTTATDEQIANGVIAIGSERFPEGTTVYFNKLIPADITLKEDGVDSTYFALQEGDVMFSDK